MTYIRRAIKYFLQTTLFCAAIIGALMLAGVVKANITGAFIYGWKSVWVIL